MPDTDTTTDQSCRDDEPLTLDDIDFESVLPTWAQYNTYGNGVYEGAIVDTDPPTEAGDGTVTLINFDIAGVSSPDGAIRAVFATESPLFDPEFEFTERSVIKYSAEEMQVWIEDVLDAYLKNAVRINNRLNRQVYYEG